MKSKKISLFIFMICIFLGAVPSCKKLDGSTQAPITVLPTPTQRLPTATQALPSPTPEPPSTSPALSPTVSLFTPTLPPPQVSIGVAIPHLTPGEDVVISYIVMFSVTDGWGIGGEEDPGDHVLRTMDGGNTWTDVTPPEPNPSVGESRKVAHGFFLDEDTAWVTYSLLSFFGIPETPIMWYTSDGGQTWEPGGSLDIRVSMDIYSPSFLHFADGQNGWFLVSVGGGMSHSYTMFFKTNDGGLKWERVIDPMNSVELQGCCKTGMVFIDEETGLVTYEQGPYANVYIEWTHDGGFTWEFQSLPPPTNDPNLFDDTYCTTHSPNLFSPQSVTLGVNCRRYEDDGTQTFFNLVYKTTDGGSTWQTYEYPGGKLQYLSPNTAFALSREIYKTTDGGETWEHVKTVYWDGQFSFINPQMCWAVVRSEEGIALVKTTNGTKTWQELKPVIGE